MLHNAAVSDKGEQKVYIFFGIIKSFKEKFNDFWEMCKIWWSKRRKLIIFVKMESDMWLVKVKCFKNIFFFHHVVSMDLAAHSLLYVHTHTHTHKYCQGIIRCAATLCHITRLGVEFFLFPWRHHCITAAVLSFFFFLWQFGSFTSC